MLRDEVASRGKDLLFYDQVSWVLLAEFRKFEHSFVTKQVELSKPVVELNSSKYMASAGWAFSRQRTCFWWRLEG